MAPSTWAKAHGLMPITVSDCLSGKPMRARRENGIRLALGMEPIVTEQITLTIEPGRTVALVRHVPRGRRSYYSRQIRLNAEERDRIDRMVRDAGFDSFNQWWQAVGWGMVESAE
jgi:hypothetical protein